MSLLKVLVAERTKRMPMSENRSKAVGLRPMPLELGVAVVTQGLYDISSKKTFRVSPGGEPYDNRNRRTAGCSDGLTLSLRTRLEAGP